MNPKNLKLEDLRGSWRSAENENHYFDLSFTESAKFLYDEITNGERVIASTRMGDPVFQSGEPPVLILEDLELSIFIFDEEKGNMAIKYPDGSKRDFKRAN